MSSGRGLLSVLIPIVLVAMVGSQVIWKWIPASAGGVGLWRIVGAAMAVYLFYLAVGVDNNVLSRRLHRTRVHCLRCGHVTGIASWQLRGKCAVCGHHAYEYLGAKGLEYARFLPGAVVLDPPAPPAAPPTPVAKPPCPPSFSSRQPRGYGATRLAAGERRRVRSRIEEVMVDRDRVKRI